MEQQTKGKAPMKITFWFDVLMRLIHYTCVPPIIEYNYKIRSFTWQQLLYAGHIHSYGG